MWHRPYESASIYYCSIREKLGVDPEFQPSSDVQVRLYFDNADFNATQASANNNVNPNDDLSSLLSLVMTKYTGPNEDNSFANNCFTGGVTTLYLQSGSGNAQSFYAAFNTQGRFAHFQIPTFSELWLHGISEDEFSPLPIVLNEFNVECAKDGVDITCSTSSEVDNEYFVIKYSDNAYDWSEVARISGLGKSNQLSQYNYKDANHRCGIGYYKLVQVDYNGDFE